MIYFEMNNIPALRFEPYMDAARDYLQRVSFQFSGYMSHSGDKLDVDNTWKKLALDLMTEKDFGSQLDKDLKADEVKLLYAIQNSATGKLKTIYDYVNKNIAWNGYNGKYAPEGLKAVWERKKGSAGEINLLLVNLLNTAGIESYPMLAAERDFGKVDTTYPFIDRFNKTVAYAIADGKEFILDATQQNCPAGLTPYPLLGTIGFLVDKKNFRLIHIAPGANSYRNLIMIMGKLDSKGLLSAETKVQSFEYARQFRLNEMKKDKKNFLSEYFEKPYEALSIDSFALTPPQFDSLPFEQIVHFKQQLNESGGFVFINCNLFTRLEKNPFISNIRFTNVNFGFPFDVTANEFFQLPAGCKVELPENKKLVSDDKKIELVRQASFENGEVRLQFRFIQTTTLIPADYYNGLKEFYKKMVEMLNEPVLVKLGN